MPSYHAAAILPGISAQTAYEVAADIESYPEFVPGFVQARIIERNENRFRVEQTIAAGPLQQSFNSIAQFKPCEYIRVQGSGGIIRGLVIEWQFIPLENGCRVRFVIEYDLDDRVPFPAAWLETLLPDVHSVLNAFTARAQKHAGDNSMSTGDQTNSQ